MLLIIINQAWAAPSYPQSATNFAGLVEQVISAILNPLIGLFIGAAVVYFLLGVLKYIRQVGDDKEREEGRKMIVYGIVALFVMVSVWGLVNVLSGTFQFGSDSAPPIPNF